MLSEDERKAIAERLSKPRPENCRPNKLTPMQREEICRMWLAGYSAPAIAKRYGVRAQTVDYHVRRAARVTGG